MSHTTVRFPDIRSIFSHGGGDVSFLTFRFQRPVGGHPVLMQAEPGGAIPLIRKLYFDTAQAWNHYTLPSLVRLIPAEHIMFVSDFPAASPLDTVNGLRDFGLDNTARARIDYGNATPSSRTWPEVRMLTTRLGLLLAVRRQPGADGQTATEAATALK